MIRIINATRRYGSGEGAVLALDGANLDVADGEFVAITGPSGCGKTTLLHLMGGLDKPDSGEVEVAGKALHKADEAELVQFRRRDLGMIFQFFHLLPTMTVAENVSLPLLLDGISPRAAAGKAADLIELVGLSGRAKHFAHQLSGGEMQRASIARALVHQPRLILADEPTGNLDTANGEAVMQIFGEIRERKLTTMILVTHSESVAVAADRRISMKDGRIVA